MEIANNEVYHFQQPCFTTMIMIYNMCVRVCVCLGETFVKVATFGHFRAWMAGATWEKKNLYPQLQGQEGFGLRCESWQG